MIEMWRQRLAEILFFSSASNQEYARRVRSLAIPGSSDGKIWLNHDKSV